MSTIAQAFFRARIDWAVSKGARQTVRAEYAWAYSKTLSAILLSPSNYDAA